MKDVKLDLLLWFIFFFDENSSCAVTCTNTYAIKSKIMSNQQLAEELHKAIIRKFEKWKVYPAFKDNIWDADLGYMQLIEYKGFWFWLFVTDI